MYFAKIKYPKDPDEMAVWNLILTVADDVYEYADLLEPKADRDMLRMWKNLSEGSDVAHATDRKSFVSQLMALEIRKVIYQDVDNKDIEQVQIRPETAFANTKKTLGGVYSSMARIIGHGTPVRVSNMGGYSPYDKLFVCVEEKAFSEKRFFNWLNNEHAPTDELIDIKGDTIIIENDRYPPRELTDVVKEAGDYFLVYDFDIRTRHYSENDFANMFSNWLDSGLENVYIETTMTNANNGAIKRASDSKQFFTVLNIFNEVLEDRGETINLFLKCPEMYESTVEKAIGNNININFLHYE